MNGQKPAAPPDFDAAFRAQLTRLIQWRRDVRHFETTQLPAGLLERLLNDANLAPSVGLSQPWRFVTVDDPDRRRRVRDNFERCNAQALSRHSGDRAGLYASLKLAGLSDAPVQLAVFIEPAPEQGHELGRLTMPETIFYSAVMAIHTLWLVARADNVGLGWVSILDPKVIAEILEVPASWSLIGYFCLGFAKFVSDRPELEQLGWEQSRPESAIPLRR